MPAGDLVTVDFTAELRATLMGVGTIYEIESGTVMITGLGTPPTKTYDLDLTDLDGAYGGRDRLQPRVITVPIVIATGSPATAMNGLKTMNTTWAPSTTDIPLYMRMPGFDKFHVNGRPRGLDADLKNMQFGVIYCLGTFVALTPTIITP